MKDKKIKLKTGEIGHLYGVRFVACEKVEPDEIRVSGKANSTPVSHKETKE